MTIGRTHDPENPLRTTACKAASLLGTGSRTPSGPAVMAPRQQAGHMIAIDPPARFIDFALASEGPFSNRASSVNCFLLAAVVAVPRSRFSPRSTSAAATSGPKHRRCNVHNGLSWKPRGPTASLAASLHPRPGGQPSHPHCRPDGSRQGLVRRPRAVAAPTSGTARRTARCCAGSPTACGPTRHAPCRGRTASRSPAPSPSGLKPA